MIVRRAAPADARAIAEVHVRTWQAAYRHAFPAEVLEALSVEERATSWRRGIEEGLPVWLAVDSGTAVGFASAGPSRTEESAGELYAIYVLPEAWGGGAGRRLISAARDWFVQEGYATAMLWVLADNPHARRFYEREGWHLAGGRLDTVRGTEVEEALYRLALVAESEPPGRTHP